MQRFVYVFLAAIVINQNGIGASNACCKNENVLVVPNCQDGSKISGVACNHRYLVGPSVNYPENITVDEDDNLIVTNAKDEHVVIAPDQYCLTRFPNIDIDHALVCLETRYLDQLPPFAQHIIVVLRTLCAIVSMLGLIATFFIYAKLKELDDIEGKCILNMVLNMAIGYLIAAILHLIPAVQQMYCDLAAFFEYFFFLFSYVWMNILAFHIWKKITITVFTNIRLNLFHIYCFYGYGLPLIIIITALVTHYTGEHYQYLREDSKKCWFTGPTALWSYFYVPETLLFIVTLILYAWVAKRLWWDINWKANSPSSVICQRKECLVYIHTFFVMTIAWILEVLSFIYDNTSLATELLWETTIYKNALQGAVLFVILVVLRKKVLRALSRNGLFCMKFPQDWADYPNEECYESLRESQSTTNV